MRRRAPIVVAAVATLLCLCGLAFGAWSGIVDGTATAWSQSLTGNQPTGTPSGGDVLVSWAASTFSDGTAATSYTVRRYQAVTGTEQTVLAGCTGSVAATSCTENSVPTGSWQYTVTPKYSGWTGAESTKSDVVVVAAVVLDSTAPTTTASPSPAANAAGWHNADVTVSLSATDPTPGVVKQITYSATGAQTISSTTVLGSSATVPAITTAGTTTLSYFAEDVAGNVETTKTLTIKLDKTAPGTATLVSLPARIRNGQSLTGTFADNSGGSGIASVAYYYCLSTVTTCDTSSGTSIGSSSTSPFSLTWNGQPADGSYKVVANALDAAGHAKLSNVVTTTVDNTAPTIGSVSLTNKAGGTPGRAEQGDTVVVQFSEAPDLTTMCSGWTGTTIGTATNNDVTVTITDGGSSAPDALSLTVGSCGGGFNFGSIALGASGSATGYVTNGGTARFRDQTTGSPSTISWDAVNNRLTITLGLASTTGGASIGTVAAGSRATYTPSNAIKDQAGNVVTGTASSPAGGGTVQQF